jgi:hypothetical protein
LGKANRRAYPLVLCVGNYAFPDLELLLFQMHMSALGLHDEMHGGGFSSGLHGAQVYLIFLRCSSFTAATCCSSTSTIRVAISRAFWGQRLTHSPQPLHFSESTAI